MSKKGGFGELFFVMILPKVYAWGATIVIVGAMFKILHLPAAGLLLGIGLATEAVIFFLSGFEPAHKEIEWSRVYPELDPNYKGPKRAMSPTSGSSGIATQLDKTLERAAMNPKILENLGKGMHNLAENASKMSNISNAAVATSEYAQNVKKASHAMGQMNQSYGTAISALSSMASTSKDVGAYHAQVQNVTKNLSALNAVYDMELKDTNTHLKSMNKFYSNVSGVMESIAKAANDSDQFRSELSKLTGNIGSLNKIYGSMLSAMKG